VTVGRFAGVVIVAAGRGERFGHHGKVLAEAAGRSLLAWSLDAAMASVTAREIVVVCGAHTRDAVERIVAGAACDLPARVCLGGADRQDSVAAGIGAISGACEVATIHDAARPLATPALFDAVAIAARERGAAIAAGLVTDTIKQVEGDRIVGTIPRDRLRAAQTPQGFRRDLLLEALGAAAAAGKRFTDEAGLLEWAGHPVTIVPVSGVNLKVTIPDDLVLADALLRVRHAGGAHDAST
jgi:2-C-methyl-D-erythritol 4-phosphate cytidylyltransferase